MARGRPKKYNKAEDMQVIIDQYFADCDTKGKPYTICGLANALDMDRVTLLEYQKDDDYSNTIKRAKMKCQQYAEEYLFTGKNAAGVIFNLKNNYSWRDKNETELTGKDGSPLLFVWSDGNE